MPKVITRLQSRLARLTDHQWILFSAGALLLLDIARAFPYAWLSRLLFLAVGAVLFGFFQRWPILLGSRRRRQIASVLAAVTVLMLYARASQMRQVALTDIEDFLGETSYCPSLVAGPFLQTAAPSLPAKARIVVRTANDVCRISTFARVMNSQPRKICPGAEAPWPRECSMNAIARLSGEAELTLAGRMLLIATVTVAVSQEGKRLVASETRQGEGSFQAMLYLFDMMVPLSEAALQSGEVEETPLKPAMVRQIGKSLHATFEGLDAQLAKIEAAQGAPAESLRAERDGRRDMLATMDAKISY